ncbi:hypothetical protein Moror_5186 [Moniliophthora roreri MCA 2997]|uniref:Uncharacterized protein n=2 Tax=Moniliophthora roreri TaxID=221103 RepID=V2WQX5_MONRO|nr:hypothetical protein Moror_5186 [Moniliophthora roreri MCA 2997]KAI3603117.1 hypothetical protein WG66_014982 [Moniliophthora roreri]
MHGNTRHFCCCLPVRLGVFIFSILGFIGSGIGAVVLWINLAKVRNQPDHEKATEIAYWVTAASVSLLAIVTFTGLIGTFMKSYRTMRFYFGALILVFILDLIFGVISMISIFRVPDEQLIQDCLHNATDGSLKADAEVTVNRAECKGIVVAVKIIFLVVYIAILLLEIFICVLVQRYSEQIRDEEYTDAAKRANINVMGGGSGLLPMKGVVV